MIAIGNYIKWKTKFSFLRYWTTQYWDGILYGILTDGITTIRKGIRDGCLVVDHTLTLLGFDGAENTDWANDSKWSAYWTLLISATIEDATPTDVVLTFPDLKNIIASDLTCTVNGASINVNSASWVGSVLTVVLASAVIYGDVVMITFKTGGTHIVTNNVLQSLARNADVVWSGGYINIKTAGGYGTNTYINKNSVTTSRINGTISKIRWHVKTVPVGAVPLIFRVFRKNGTKYDKIFEEDICTKMVSNTEMDVVLNAGCVIAEGDYIHISAGAGYDFSVHDIALANSMLYGDYATYEPPLDIQADLDAYPSNTSNIMTLHLFSQAPIGVIIGDSIGEGFPGHSSGVDPSLTNNPANSISGQLYLMDNKYVIQNMAYGGVGVSYIVAGYTFYVQALKPRFVISTVGVNNIKDGTATKAQYIAAYTTFLNSCVADGIIPIVCKIAPWTNGTNAQMQTRDDWNTDLQALVATYSRSVWVDFDPDLGKFRVGGDPGNKWDIQTTPDYDQDGLHYTLLGCAKMAEVVDIAIKAKYKLT